MIQGTKENKFVLSGDAQVVKRVKIVLPGTATGIIYGCVAYNLSDGYSKNT